MQEHDTKKGKHLTSSERRWIERWKSEGHSHRQIAKLLGKAPQTLNNEVKRGLVRQQVCKGKFGLVYCADYVQNSYEKNRTKSVGPVALTKELKDKILHYWLHRGYLGIERSEMYPRKQKAGRKQASPNFKPAGQSIEERPAIINQRLENGHYEIDTVILTQARNHCLLVLTDRRSRHQIIRPIPDKTVKSVNSALKEIMRHQPIKSITADNGPEFSRLSEVFPQEHIYYAHLYSS